MRDNGNSAAVNGSICTARTTMSRSPVREPSTANACTFTFVRLIPARCSGRSPTAHGCTPAPSTRHGTSTLHDGGRFEISSDPAPPPRKSLRPHVFGTFAFITYGTFVSIALTMYEQYSCVRVNGIGASPRASRAICSSCGSFRFTQMS